MLKLTVFEAQQIASPKAISTTKTDDSGVVSFVFDDFSVRLTASSKALNASAVIALNLKFESKIKPKISAIVSFGGFLANASEATLSILSQSTFAQKLLTREDTETGSSRWLVPIHPEAANELQLILLLQMRRENIADEISLSWDTIDLQLVY